MLARRDATVDFHNAALQRLKEENSNLRRALTSPQHEATEPLGPAISQHEEAAPQQQQPTSSNSLSPGGSMMSPAESSSEGPDDVFALEVGYLSLIATGETRYLGSSSGIGLATIVSKVLHAQSGISLLTVDQLSESGRRQNFVSSPPVPTGNAPLATRSVAMPFIDTYFQHTHITFPLLHRPSFLGTVDKIYNEPGYYESNNFDAFAFDMVLAIGASNFNRFGESTAGASEYYAAATRKVDRMMEMDGFTTLKSILLICQHAIFSNLRDTSANVWHLVGIGARICIELGLHLERKSMKHGPEGLALSVDRISLEEEMRRRCFWCLYNLDRPVVIRDEEIDVPLPSHMDDESFSPELPITIEMPMADSLRENTSPFLHLIRIRRLSGQILGLFYNSRSFAKTSIWGKRQTRRKFYLELNAWWDDIQYLHLSQSQANQDYTSSFLSLDWYKAVYNNAILLLYRPSPSLPHPTMVPDTEDEEPDLIILLNAAKGSITSYSDLHQKRRLHCSWITLHAVFLGGLAYIYCVGRILRDPTVRQLVPGILSIVETTRACSNVLVAICERWNASRRSCELFDKLTNAVITDALNLSTKPNTGNVSQGRTRPTSSPTNMDGGSPALHQGQPHQRQSHQYNPMVGMDLMDPMSQLDDMLVMDEFRQFSGTFGMEYCDEQGGFPSELVSGFAQDWSFDESFSTNPFDGPNNGTGPNWRYP
ncbi:putative C6 zinc finger domain-containing protein [Seiridium cardinale]|uniref:C6 zinc finger domain-containing protein n=1 Tax=Seiridium cardinale TaxID=138064 RepID=A0ABR2XTM9_9PEZI